MDKDNFFVKSQIQSNISQVEKLLDTGVFVAEILDPFREPVFVSAILKLNDLLQKFDQLGKRINFEDDILSGDITDLINKIRNAICHLDSGENILDKESQIKFVFNSVRGKGTGFSINGKSLRSDYEDDIAFFFGEHRIYLKRHIYRILKEAHGVFKELYAPDPHA